MRKYIFSNQESVADFVIQATRTMEFEDGVWIGNQLKAQNGLLTAALVLGLTRPREVGMFALFPDVRQNP